MPARRQLPPPAPGPARPPAAASRLDHVRSVLREAGAPLTTNEVAERGRLSVRQAYDALQILHASGGVQRGGGGRKAPPGAKQFRWRLPPGSHPARKEADSPAFPNPRRRFPSETPSHVRPRTP